MFSFITDAFKKKSNNQNQPIHLIWIGDKLREQDIEKAKKWKKLNPESKVTVWTELSSANTFQDQLQEDKGIIIRNFSELQISKPVTELLTALTKPREDKLVFNPAAASDIYRFYILDAFAGWYFDFDKTPIAVNYTTIDPNHKFLIHGLQKPVIRAIPDVIGCLPENNLTKMAIVILEEVAPLLLQEEFLKLIRSNKASVRFKVTEQTTGIILRYCLMSLLVNGNPIFAFQRDLDPLPDPKVFQAIAKEFDRHFEKSWLNIPGIIKDPRFLMAKEKYYSDTPEASRYINIFRMRLNNLIETFTLRHEIANLGFFSRSVSSVIADYAIEPDVERQQFRMLFLD